MEFYVGPAEQLLQSQHLGSTAFGQRQLTGCSGAPWSRVPVTPEDEVVWEYIVPIVRGTDEDAELDEIYKTVMSDTEDNSIFDATWIAPDHPGLAGRDLASQGKITDILD